MKKLIAALICTVFLAGCGDAIFSTPAPSTTESPETAVASETPKASDITDNTPEETEQDGETEEKKKVRVIPVPLTAKKLTFETTDLDYNEVDTSIFSDYEITMVNIWATWCGPCVYEMPFIAEAYTMLPENANLITICSDAGNSDTDYDDAVKILSNAEAGFQTLFPDSNLYTFMNENITAIPTTVFVNANGQIVGDMQVGMPYAEDVAQGYIDIINEKLAK